MEKSLLKIVLYLYQRLIGLHLYKIETFRCDNERTEFIREKRLMYETSHTMLPYQPDDVNEIRNISTYLLFFVKTDFQRKKDSYNVTPYEVLRKMCDFY